MVMALMPINHLSKFLATGCLASMALVSRCTEPSGHPVPEPTPEFSVTPAAWADYEREKLTPADCPDFAADAGQELLGSKGQPWVFDVIRDVTAVGETSRFQCSFSDPKNLDNQVVFQMNRTEDSGDRQGRTPLILSVMGRLKSKSPLNERYPGFGNNTKVGEYGGQTAMWACGNQWLSVSVQQGATAQKDQAALLWKHFEPTIQRHCGTVEQWNNQQSHWL